MITHDGIQIVRLDGLALLGTIGSEIDRVIAKLAEMTAEVSPRGALKSSLLRDSAGNLRPKKLDSQKH